MTCMPSCYRWKANKKGTNMNKQDTIHQSSIKTLDDGTTNIIITKDSIYDDHAIFNFRLSTGEIIADLAWMGASLKTGMRIFQPAIVTNQTAYKISLSYDGRANYIKGSDEIVMPSDGSTYTIAPPTLYYFNNNNPLLPNPEYELSDNNKSLYLRNISIFKEDRSQGVMVSLRASMEGSVIDPPNTGFVIISIKVETIN